MSASGLLPVSGLWIGDSLPSLARLTMASFVHHGHPYRLYSYRKFENVPAGVEERDAGEVLADLSGGMSAVAAFSDWFRWELLSREAGWWVDMDTLCQKPLEVGGELAFGLEDTASPGVPLSAAYGRAPDDPWRIYSGPMVNGAVLKSGNPRNALVRRMVGYCRYPELYILRNIRRRYKVGYNFGAAADYFRHLLRGRPTETRRRWLRRRFSPLGGPRDLTDEVVHGNLLKYVRPTADFYPVHWKQWETLYDGTYAGVEDPFPDSYAVHLWNNMLQRSSQRPASGSFVDRMLRRYGIEWE